MKKIIKFLGSAGFAALLAVLIAFLSALGSVIPQGDGAAVLEKLSSFFGSDAANLHAFLISTGLIDVYGSLPFLILVFLFAINLTLCTLKLIPFAIKEFSDYDIKLTETISTAMTESEIHAKLIKDGWKGSRAGAVFRASKHDGGRYGVIILHTGVIFVLLGALIGHVIGFNGFMNILEGTDDDVAVLPSGELIPLGFGVRCDEFDAEYYSGTLRPKSYTSKISILENGVKIKTANIDVNHPLKYKGVVFYQTNFGVYPNKDAKVRFRIKKNDSDEIKKEVSFGELFVLSGDYVGKITDFAPTLASDKDGNIYSASDEMKNPAFLLEVYKTDEPVLRGWILKNNQESGFIEEIGVRVIFDELWGLEYTGLYVKKDPGTPAVYAGFVLISFGIIFIYLLNYTAVFFTVEDKDGKRLIRYAVRQRRKYPLFNLGDSFKLLFS